MSENEETNGQTEQLKKSQVVIEYDHATGNCSYRLDAGFPHPMLINTIELIKAQSIATQIAGIAQQQQRQQQMRIIRPGDRF